MQQSLLNIRCVIEACTRLQISHQIYDANQNFVEVQIKNKPYIFANFSTPFNSDSVSYVCKDKDFTYKLLKDTIEMPRTLSFFDPGYENEAYKKYISHKDHNSIVEEIVKTFNFPIIVKMNSGSMGKNVFLCNTRSEILTALQAIYKKDSPLYDYVALAQEQIQIKREYRAVVFEGKIMLLYEKDFSQATYVDNLSPLHQANSKTIHILDEILLEEINTFIKPIFGKFNIQFAGLDVILDSTGKLFLLEINSKPGFSYFAKDNGEDLLIQMYTNIFTLIQNRT